MKTSDCLRRDAAASLAPELLHILQHSLGVDKYGQGEMNRNHFCAGGSDETLCRELVTLGYMRKWPGTDVDGRKEGYPYFNCSVTEEGKAAMLRESPKPPTLTRAQQRYRAFLKSGARDCGIGFREWLVGQGAGHRAAAGKEDVVGASPQAQEPTP